MRTPIGQKHSVVLAVMALALSYAGVASSLVEVWSRNYVYSYGFAVPLISGYLVWTARPHVQSMPRKPDYWWGIPILLAGVLTLVIGRLGSLLALQASSLVFTLSGLVLLFKGRRAFRAVAFPILYLVLCMPLWDYPIAMLQEPSQTISARAALAMLHSVGVPALREETRLVLPTVTLDVLRECSGVNQLVAIVAITLPAGFLWLQSTTRRLGLIALAVITAYASNGFRIALIGFLAYNNVNGAHDQGFLHLLQGLMVSGIGYIAIGACLSLLAKTEHRRPTDGLAESSCETGASRNARRPFIDALALCSLLTAGAYATLFQPVDVRLQKELWQIPTVIGDWTAEPRPAPSASTSSARFGFAGMDAELSRVYRNSAGTRVQLFIAYHNYQKEGKEFTRASDRALRVGTRQFEFRVAGTDRDVAQFGTSAQDNHRRVFWYDVNGRVLSSLYRAKVYNIWDALTTGRTNAAVVVVAWDRADDDDSDGSLRDRAKFVEQLIIVLRNCLPLPDNASMASRGSALTIAMR